MNWGYRIVLAFGAGVAFILFFVWKTMQVDIEMVESNYYEKEMEHNWNVSIVLPVLMPAI